MSALVWITTFLTYAATTSRDILAADSGEFQFIAAGWGIGHPPGYPLYTVIAALWVRLFPSGTVPFRVNLLSAALAATTLVLCLETVKTWARVLGATPKFRTIGALITVLALGSAATFWAQATTANIRMPTLLFTAWGYLALARYHAALGSRHNEDRALLSLAIATGLGVGHHPSLVFIASGWALTLLLLQPRLLASPLRWLRPVGVAAIAWAIPQLYLPLRGSGADAPLSPGDLATWQGFWDHVLARGFGGDMFAFATLEDLALRLPLLPDLFKLQFPTLILVGMGATWVVILKRDTGIATALLVPWVIQSFVTITYRAPQTVEYLMPAYLPMALSLGIGLTVLATRSPRSKRNHSALSTMPIGLVLLLLAWQLPGNLRDFLEIASDTSVREYVAPLLNSAPQDALVLADWRWATPLWVLQATEKLAPEVEVTYINPEADREYEDVWKAHANEAGDRPLFVTHAYTWNDWTAMPVGGGLRLYKRPLIALPSDMEFTPLQGDLGPIQLLGMRWRGEPQPGSTIELQVAWQASPRTDSGTLEPEPSFATRLWNGEAQLLSASDQALGTRTADGEVRFTRLTHQLPIDQCAPVVYPTLGVYNITEDGFQDLGSISLPDLPTTCQYPILPTRRFWPGYVWPDGPLLRGVDYDVRDDGSATTYLHWCGPGDPLVIQNQGTQVTVDALHAGECQTIRIAVTSSERIVPDFERPDGANAKLLALPLPSPKAGERYLPFGAEMILIDDQLTQFSGNTLSDTTLLTLQWLTAKPIQQDYAVSVRFKDATGAWLGTHDIQPGLGAIPTLKWVVRGKSIRDPHPVTGLSSLPSQYSIVVYDRFRLTTLRSVDGSEPSYHLP